MELRGQGRSQMEFGNEGGKCNGRQGTAVPTHDHRRPEVDGYHGAPPCKPCLPPSSVLRAKHPHKKETPPRARRDGVSNSSKP